MRELSLRDRKSVGPKMEFVKSNLVVSLVLLYIYSKYFKKNIMI